MILHRLLTILFHRHNLLKFTTLNGMLKHNPLIIHQHNTSHNNHILTYQTLHMRLVFWHIRKRKNGIPIAGHGSEIIGRVQILSGIKTRFRCNCVKHRREWILLIKYDRLPLTIPPMT